MVEDFTKAAHWLFFLFFVNLAPRKCLSSSIFKFIYSYLLFYVTAVDTACCVEFHGQPVVIHLIALDVFTVLKFLWQYTLDYSCSVF